MSLKCKYLYLRILLLEYQRILIKYPIMMFSILGRFSSIPVRHMIHEKSAIEQEKMKRCAFPRVDLLPLYRQVKITATASDQCLSAVVCVCVCMMCV